MFLGVYRAIVVSSIYYPVGLRDSYGSHYDSISVISMAFIRGLPD